MGKKKPSAPQPPQKMTPEQVYLKEYDVLCKKHGLQIASFPQFWRRDDGSYSVKIQHQTVPLS